MCLRVGSGLEKEKKEEKGKKEEKEKGKGRGSSGFASGVAGFTGKAATGKICVRG